MQIKLSLWITNHGRNVLLDIERGRMLKTYDLPGDQLFTRVQEHVNNALRGVCTEIEADLKTLRSGGANPENKLKG